MALKNKSAGSKKDKHGYNKIGKKGNGPSGSSFFMWFMIIALLGVWSSVAVVWFDLVDYEDVLGKLGIHDADGDGDFDVEDAKILLGLKKGAISAEHFEKNEEPVQPSVHPPIETEIEQEAPEPIKATVSQESFKTNIEESIYVEDEAFSERAHLIEDSGPEVTNVPEDKFPESEESEEGANYYTVSDEAVLDPREVVSEQDIPGYESEIEEFSDHLDSEGEMEEDLPISDEFIEDNDLEPEDRMEEYYAEESEYIPGTDDIQEALPVQKSDEDLSANASQNLDVESEIQVAVPLPEVIEEPMEKEDDTLEATKEHLAEGEQVNYTEDHPEVSEPAESDPTESDHLENTDETKETIIAEPELSPPIDKQKEESSDL